MTDKTRSEIAKEAAFRREHGCPKCNATLEDLDGSQCGGFPGVPYRRCNACGYVVARPKRPRKAESPLFGR
jgi:hypothetical protein